MIRSIGIFLIVTIAAVSATLAEPDPLPPGPFSGLPVDPPGVDAQLDSLQQALIGIDVDRMDSAASTDLRGLDRLQQDLDRLSAYEGALLDLRRPIAARLGDPGLVLIEESDGRIIGLDRTQARDRFGARYDTIIAAAGPDGILAMLPQEARADIRMAIDSGFGRIAFVDEMMARARAEQARLRRIETARLERIDNYLQDLRALADEIRVTRDRLIAMRDATPLPFPDGTVCLDPAEAPETLFAYASPPYGGGHGIPVYGPVICHSPTLYFVDTGQTLQEFRCSLRTDGGRDCRLAQSHPYEPVPSPEPGVSAFRYVDGSMTFSYAPAE